MWIQYGSDSAVILTKNQYTKIILNDIECRAKEDSINLLLNKNNNCNEISDAKSALIKRLNDRIKNYDLQLDSYYTLSVNYETEIETLNKKIRRLEMIRNALIGISAISILTLIIK